MSSVRSSGMGIHYEVEGQGPPLVLQHGLSGCLDNWYECGLVDALKNDYQLILVDALGHGGSDKPHQPAAYELKCDVNNIVAVLNDLNLSKSFYWGYSMGGTIGYGIAKFAPERFRALIIGGAHAYSSKNNSDTQESTYGLIRLLDKGMDDWVAEYQYTVEVVEALPPLTSQSKIRMLANDPKALIARLLATPTSVEEVLTANILPCLIYAGEADDGTYSQAQASAKQMPNATFVGVPGRHQAAYQKIEPLLPYVQKFLVSVSKV